MPPRWRARRSPAAGRRSRASAGTRPRRPPGTGSSGGRRDAGRGRWQRAARPLDPPPPTHALPPAWLPRRPISDREAARPYWPDESHANCAKPALTGGDDGARRSASPPPARRLHGRRSAALGAGLSAQERRDVEIVVRDLERGALAIVDPRAAVARAGDTGRATSHRAPAGMV